MQLIARWLTIAAAVVLPTCSGGGARVGGASSSAVVDAAGGQLVSADGRLTLTVPAGALGAPETITITALAASDLTPPLGTATPLAAYRLEPDGLQFAAPVAFALSAGAPVANTAGSAATGVIVPVTDSAAGLEAVDDLEIDVDAETGTTTVSGAISHFSDIVVYRDLPGLGALVELAYPPAIDPGMAGVVTGTVTQDMSSVESSGAISWRATTDQRLMSDIETTSVFDAGGLLSNTQQTLMNTSSLTCLSPGKGSFSVRFDVTGYDLSAGLLADTGQFDVRVTFRNLSVTCNPGGTAVARLIDVIGITAIEAVRVVSPPAACGPTPSILVAGDGGANILDPFTGAVASTVLPAAGGTFFDALFLPAPSPTDDASYFLSGLGLLAERVDSSCVRGPFAQTGTGTHLDATYAGADPARGAHAAGTGQITEVVFDPLSQGWIFQDTGIPQGVLPIGFRSVQGNADGDKFLAVGQFELTLVDDSGATPTSQSAFPLGQNPRRIRWDPTSGFGAISDLDDDTLTVFTWDGETLPVLTDVIAVGAGPVGIDVMGNRIVCAGFFDDTYTLVLLDANGMASQVTVTPSPFTGGGTQPGHAVFLRDAGNAIVISFNGDDKVGVIPGAF